MLSKKSFTRLDSKNCAYYFVFDENKVDYVTILFNVKTRLKRYELILEKLFLHN